MTDDEFATTCLNVGMDLQCGACATLFYHGNTSEPHKENCQSLHALRTDPSPPGPESAPDPDMDVQETTGCVSCPDCGAVLTIKTAIVKSRHRY